MANGVEKQKTDWNAVYRKAFPDSADDVRKILIKVDPACKLINPDNEPRLKFSSTEKMKAAQDMLEKRNIVTLVDPKGMLEILGKKAAPKEASSAMQVKMWSHWNDIPEEIRKKFDDAVKTVNQGLDAGKGVSVSIDSQEHARGAIRLLHLVSTPIQAGKVVVSQDDKLLLFTKEEKAVTTPVQSSAALTNTAELTKEKNPAPRRAPVRNLTKVSKATTKEANQTPSPAVQSQKQLTSVKSYNERINELNSLISQTKDKNIEKAAKSLLSDVQQLGKTNSKEVEEVLSHQPEGWMKTEAGLSDARVAILRKIQEY